MGGLVSHDSGQSFCGKYSVGCGKRHRMRLSRLSPSLNGVEGCTRFSVLEGESLETKAILPICLNQVSVTALIRSPNYYKECRQCQKAKHLTI